MNNDRTILLKAKNSSAILLDAHKLWVAALRARLAGDQREVLMRQACLAA
jgi:hypothetical protein